MLGYLFAGELVEVNSGGQVLFCFFSPAGQVSGSRQRGTQSIDLGNLHQSSMPEQHADGWLLIHSMQIRLSPNYAAQL